MTEIEQPAPQKTFLVGNFLRRRLIGNPVTMKELRARMRGVRTYVILTIYLALISGLVGIIYLSFVSAENQRLSPDTYQLIGKTIFGVVLALQFALISVIAPALTAGAIASEKERKTFDLIRTTLLPARALVNGKLLAAVLFLLLLLFAALPLQSLAYLLGGVGFVEIGISTLMLVICTFSFCLTGVFFSSVLKRTLPATILSYLASAGFVIVLPILLFLLLSLFGPFIGQFFYGGYGQSPPEIEPWQVYTIAAIVWLVLASNPVLAALTSELLLVEEQALFTWNVPLNSNLPAVTIISPWIGFCVFYLLISLILYLLSILIVKRKEK
jgi:ABC-type transport system involved in multi-copper enzyme maturation permease subunit